MTASRSSRRRDHRSRPGDVTELPSDIPVPGDASLAGRVVVVTGASRGIGRAVARTAAAFGAHVALCDKASGLAEVCAALPPGTESFAAELDVRDREAVDQFATQVAARFGVVHGLVNNAGGTFRSEFLAATAKGDAALIAENFTSVVDVTRAVVPFMSDGGSIVNVTSSEAFQAAPGFSVYAAMKAAQENLTRTLALEFADRRIRVNAVAPDGIPTEGDDELASATQREGTFRPPPCPPVGRFAAPSSCAAVVAFLLGDLAGFVTGASIHVDGGLHAAGGWHRSAAE